MIKIFESKIPVVGVLFFVAQIAFLSGCALHKYIARPFDVSPYSSKTLGAYSTAVVFAPRLEKDEYDDAVLAQAFQKIFTDKLGKTFKELKFVPNEKAAGSYDWVMISTLRAKTVNDYFTNGCLLNFTIEIKNKAGKVMAKSNAELKRSFSFGPDKAFKGAMSDIFDKVMDEALTTLEKKI